MKMENEKKIYIQIKKIKKKLIWRHIAKTFEKILNIAVIKSEWILISTEKGQLWFHTYNINWIFFEDGIKMSLVIASPNNTSIILEVILYW